MAQQNPSIRTDLILEGKVRRIESHTSSSWPAYATAKLVREDGTNSRIVFRSLDDADVKAAHDLVRASLGNVVTVRGGHEENDPGRGFVVAGLADSNDA